MEDYDISGAEGLDLHHFYRAMAWLGEEVEEKPERALARLGNSQPGDGQQRDQSGVRLSSDRSTRTESTGGFEEAIDFVG
jgi:hypothetical protein